MDKLLERYPRDHVCVDVLNLFKKFRIKDADSILIAQLVLQTIPFSHFRQVDGPEYKDMGLVRYGRDAW
jgi:hypothetical protein